MALINAVFAIIGGGLAGAIYHHWREYRNRPILEIDFQDDRYHRIESTHELSHGKEDSFVYIRVRIRNTGRHVSKTCHVFLARLDEVHPSNQTTPAVFLGSRQLAWAGYDFTAFDLPRGLDFYADVLRVSKTTPGWGISVKEFFASEQSLNDYRGTYRFHLIATSDNAEPATCIVNVSYDGNWHNLRAVAETNNS